MSSLCLLLLHSVIGGIDNGGEEGVFFFIFFLMISVPVFGFALASGAIALGLLLAVVVPMSLVWLAEDQPERPATLAALTHALVACITPFALIALAVFG